MSVCEFSIVLSVFKQFKALDNDIKNEVNDSSATLFDLIADYNTARDNKKYYAEKWNTETKLRSKMWAMSDALNGCMFDNSACLRNNGEKIGLTKNMLDRVVALYKEILTLKKYIFGYDL
jgi:hypothetical protein